MALLQFCPSFCNTGSSTACVWAACVPSSCRFASGAPTRIMSRRIRSLARPCGNRSVGVRSLSVMLVSLLQCCMLHNVCVVFMYALLLATMNVAVHRRAGGAIFRHVTALSGSDQWPLLGLITAAASRARSLSFSRSELRYVLARARSRHGSARTSEATHTCAWRPGPCSGGARAALAARQFQTIRAH